MIWAIQIDLSGDDEQIKQLVGAAFLKLEMDLFPHRLIHTGRSTELDDEGKAFLNECNKKVILAVLPADEQWRLGPDLKAPDA